MLKELEFCEIDVIVGGVCMQDILQYTGHAFTSAGLVAMFTVALFKDDCTTPNIRLRALAVVGSAAIAAVATVMVDVYAIQNIFKCN